MLNYLYIEAYRSISFAFILSFSLYQTSLIKLMSLNFLTRSVLTITKFSDVNGYHQPDLRTNRTVRVSCS